MNFLHIQNGSMLVSQFKKLRLLILPAIFIIAFSLLSWNANATHIMGGDLTYRSLGVGKVEIKLVFYRDCGGGGPTVPAQVDYKVFNGQDSSLYGNYSMKVYKINYKISAAVGNCKIAGSTCIDQGIFYDTITLGNDTVGYHILWAAVNRNLVITNLQRCVGNSDNSSCNASACSGQYPFGVLWHAFVPRKAYINSSPQWLTVPIPYMCAGKCNIFNQLVSDPDGDSLVFSIETPLSPPCASGFGNPTIDLKTGFKFVQYQSGYSVTKPFGSSSAAITIDKTTGELTACPLNSGNYVVAVAVKEYRVDPITHTSVFLGTITRDLQYYVASCPTNTNKPPKFTNTDTVVQFVYPDSTLCFTMTSSDPNATDTLTMWASGSIFKGAGSAFSSNWATFPGDTAVKSQGWATSKFCWTPNCSQVTYSSPYVITIYLADNGCNIISKTFSIYVTPRDIIAPPKVRCVDIVDNSTVKLTFNQTSTKNFFYKYNIYRRTGTSGAFTKVDSIFTRTTTSWTDTKATNAFKTIYQYYIKGVNTCLLEGSASDSVSSMIVSMSSNSDKKATYTWNKQRQKGSLYYRIYENTGSGYVLVDSTIKTNTNYSFASCNKTLNIKIGVANGGCISFSNPSDTAKLKDVTGPELIGRLWNANVINTTRVDVTFHSSDSADTKEYYVYRSVNGGVYKCVDTIAHKLNSVLTSSDNTVNAATADNCYKIIAIDTCGTLSLYSTVHCLSNLTGTAGNLLSSLKWKNYSGYTTDTVEVQKLISGVWKTISYAKITDTMYTDKGLACNVPYYYRILSREKMGNNQYNYSDTVRVIPFDTIRPNQVNILNVSVVSGTSNDITFEKVADLDVKKYEIWVSTNNGSSYSLLTTLSNVTTSPFTYTHKAITPSTITYFYKIFAEDSCSANKSLSSEAHGHVQLGALAQNLAVKLDWSTYHGFASVKNYVVQRKNGASWITVTTLTDKDSTYTETGLKCGIPYTYRINVNEKGGDNQTAYSDTVSATPFDTFPPAMVNMLDASVSAANAITVTFKKVADLDVKKYEIWFKKNSGTYALLTTVNNPVSNPVNYVHTGINPQIDQYSYYVIAIDSCGGNKSKTYETHSPVNISGQGLNQSALVTWKPYTGFPVKNYTIQKRKGVSWITLYVAASTDTSYLDKNLTCNIPQVYRILSDENGGDKASSYSDTITLLPTDTVKPNAVILHYASLTNDSTIFLKWSKTKDVDVLHYIIYRSADAGATWAAIDTIKTDTFYSDKFAKPVTQSYCYSIAPMDSCSFNVGAKSSSHCTMYETAIIKDCQQKIFLTWNAYVGFASIKNYRIYRSVNGGAEALLNTVTAATLTYTDTQVVNTKNYCYRILASENGSSFTSYSNQECNQPFKPVTPEILYATKTVTSATIGKITIKWKSLLKIPHMKYVDLYYRFNGTGAYSVIASNVKVSTDSFVHTGLNTQFKNHEYYLLAYDSCGNVSDSSFHHYTMEAKLIVGQLTHEIFWTPYKGWPVKNYILQTFLGGIWVNTDTLAPNIFYKKRIPVQCNAPVYYRVQALNALGVTALSDTCGGQAIDNIPSNGITWINATVTSGTNTQLDFKGADSLDIYAYNIQRSDNGGVFNSIGTVYATTPGGNKTFNDKTGTLTDQHCYKIIALDSCLNATGSAVYCVIQLKGTALNQALDINWHPFKGYTISSYDIQHWNGTAWVKIGSTPGTDTSMSYTNMPCGIKQTYKIIGYEKSGSRVTASDSITLIPYDTIKPKAPLLKNASVVLGSGYKLDWTWNVSGDAKKFEIYRADTTKVYSLIKTITSDSTYLDNSISSKLNQKYFYYVVEIDSCDISHRSPTSNVIQTIKAGLSTGGCIPLINLNWSAFADLPGKVDNYVVHRSTNGISYSPIKTLSATTYAYTDTTVSLSTRYYYRIEASDKQSGLSSFSDSTSLIPFMFPLPVGVKMIASTVTKTGTSTGEIKLDWTMADTTDVYAKGYNLYSSTTGTGSFKLIQDIKSLKTTTYTYTGLDTKNKNYYFYVAPYNICNREGAASPRHKDMNLSVANNNLSTTISWNTYQGFVVKNYDLYKATNSGAFTKIASLTSADSTYTDNNILCKQKYTYQIFAYENGGYSANSASDTVSVIGSDNIPPSIPDLRNASIITTDQITGTIDLLFDGSTELNRKGYYIFRSTNGGSAVLIDSIKTTLNSNITYTDKNLDTKTNIYTYTIRSFDSCGNVSSNSNQSTVMHLDAKPFNSMNALTWTPFVGYTNYDYTILRNKGGSVWDTIGRVNNGNNYFEDDYVTCHAFYKYLIVATDLSSGLISFSSMDTATSFDTVAPLKPFVSYINVTTTSTYLGKIMVTWDKSPSTDVSSYQLWRRTAFGNWYMVKNGIVDTFYEDTKLNTYRTKYSYRIRTVDSCFNISQNDTSNYHRNIVLTVKPGNEFIDVNYTPYIGFNVKRYEVYRDGVYYSSISKDSTHFKDAFVVCTKTYQYVVKAIGVDSSKYSYSNLDSVMPFDFNRPKPVYLVHATVDEPNNIISMNWERSSSFDVLGYAVYRKDPGGFVTKIHETKNVADTFYVDTFDLHDSYCYHVVAFDYCRNSSPPSNPGCIIFIRGRADNLQNSIWWNPYSLWADGIDHYNIYKKEDSGSWTLISTVGQSQLNFTDDLTAPNDTFSKPVKEHCYQVEAIEATTPRGYNSFSKSTIVCLNQKPIIWIPNAFSPLTSIGLNDGFGVQGTWYDHYEMEIFNRWGERVYKTNNSKPWDGKYNGNLTDDGVYLYKIVVYDYKKLPQRFEGTLNVMK